MTIARRWRCAARAPPVLKPRFKTKAGVDMGMRAPLALLFARSPAGRRCGRRHTASGAMPLALSQPAAPGAAALAARSRRPRARAAAPCTTALLKVSQGWEQRIASWTQTDKHVIVKVLLGSTTHPSGAQQAAAERRLGWI